MQHPAHFGSFELSDTHRCGSVIDGFAPSGFRLGWKGGGAEFGALRLVRLEMTHWSRLKNVSGYLRPIPSKLHSLIDNCRDVLGGSRCFT
jgi:hypothetical protein